MEAKKEQKSILERLGHRLERLGSVLEASWALLEASWAVLEASWRRLRPSWRRLGGILEAKMSHDNAKTAPRAPNATHADKLGRPNAAWSAGSAGTRWAL